MTPKEFDQLIRKTLVYLDFHDDDAAKYLRREWREILARIQRLQGPSSESKSSSASD